jgi:hypothetical protein
MSMSNFNDFFRFFASFSRLSWMIRQDLVTPEYNNVVVNGQDVTTYYYKLLCFC